MQFGEFFWDGDKRVIYEAPSTNFDYVLDVDGYRIYTPIDTQIAPFEVTYDLREDLWSRYVDYMDAIEWATQAFSKSGGASRGLDNEGNESFATADFKATYGWKIVPANYYHSILILGNFLADTDAHTEAFPVLYPLIDMWDGTRLTEQVFMHVRGADSFQNYVIDNGLGDDTDAPNWLAAVGISDLYQDGTSFRIRWNAAVDNSLDEVLYNIYISRFDTTVFESYNIAQTVTGNLTTTRYEDNSVTPLEDGVTYYIGVRAIDESGNETTNTNFASITYSIATAGTVNANIVSVNGTAVLNIDEFKADAVDIDVSSIVAGLLNADINTYNLDHSIGEAMARLGYIGAKVYVNTELPDVGDGTQEYPFNLVSNAKDFAEANGIRDIVVTGDIVVPGNIKNMTIHGIGVPRIDLNGMDVSNTHFHQVSLSGIHVGSIVVRDSVLEDGLTVNGFFDNCILDGWIHAQSNAKILFKDCASAIPGLIRPRFYMNSGTPTVVGFRSYSGGLDVYDCDHIDDTITVGLDQGSLKFDVSCVAGTMLATGVGLFENETIDNPNLLVKDEVVYNYDDSIVQTKLDIVTNDVSSVPQWVWEYVERELTNVAPTPPSFIMSDTVYSGMPTTLAMKINHNPTFDNYTFDVDYRIPGMIDFVPLNIQLTEMEVDFYFVAHSFVEQGSNVLRFTEIDSKLEPLYFTINVLDKPETSDSTAWKVSI